MRVLRDCKDWVQALAWSPNGQWLASGDDTSTVRVWDTDTWACVQALECVPGWEEDTGGLVEFPAEWAEEWSRYEEACTREVRLVTWSLDGHWLVANCESPFVWDTTSWARVSSLPPERRPRRDSY